MEGILLEYYFIANFLNFSNLSGTLVVVLTKLQGGWAII